MNIRIGLLTLSLMLVALLAVGALAHGGKTHVMGTITALDAEHVVVQSREGQSVSIHLTKQTVVQRDTPAAASDLKVGDRVVVDVTGKDPDLTATQIRVGTGSAEPGHSGQHQHGQEP